MVLPILPKKLLSLQKSENKLTMMSLGIGHDPQCHNIYGIVIFTATTKALI